MYFDKERNEVRNIDSHTDFSGLTATNKLVLTSEQVEAVKMVIDHYKKENEEAKNEIHKNTWNPDGLKMVSISIPDDDPRWSVEVGSADLPIIYIAEYTTRDDYGPLRQQDVFVKEEDAWAFVLKQREEGANNISVKRRLVYLDKDRTVNIDE